MKSTKYRGVIQRGAGWMARKDGRYVGPWETETEAALVYDCVLVRQLGKWATRLNFPRACKDDRKTVLFVGFGRAGKDASAEFICSVTRLRYCGSFSWSGLPFMADKLKQHPQQAWEHRHENRELWKSHLDYLRLHDQTFLASLALAQGEVAAGLRDRVEIEAVRRAGLFKHIVWIDRPGTPVDPTVTFGPEHADEVILNDGPLEKLHSRLYDFCARKNLPLK